ncbi:MAG: TIGR02281 family clan AA aspartic protease [Idiomarina sp.]|nr:TIGR02281 family clan AA aspartic protease [Idiomarina sp.]
MNEQYDEERRIGGWFYIFAWAAALFVLYFFFNSYLEGRDNPNRQLDTYRDGGQAVVVLEQNRGGHYIAKGFINQQQVNFLLDTGATQVAIPGDMSERLGLSRGNRVQVRTANGIATAYQTQIDELRLGEIVLYNVSGTIVPDYDSEHVLLGMSALRTLEFTQRDRRLTIRQ